MFALEDEIEQAGDGSFDLALGQSLLLQQFQQGLLFWSGLVVFDGRRCFRGVGRVDDPTIGGCCPGNDNGGPPLPGMPGTPYGTRRCWDPIWPWVPPRELITITDAPAS